MDDRQFDTLIQVLSSSPNRRAAVRGLAGLALGSLLGIVHEDEGDVRATSGQRKKPGGCGHGKKQCHGKCIKKSQCCSDRDCTGDQICQGKTCVCPQGTKLCADACIPSGNCCVSADCAECESCQSGSCVSGCLPGQTCQGGTCACPNGQKECQSACIPQSQCCGSGDCQTGQLCQQGQCICNETSCLGCCAGTTCKGGGSAAFCGQGGGACHPCGQDELCVDGQCQPLCPSGQKLCAGQCIRAADPCFQRVTPSNLRGWLLYGEDPFSNDPSLTQIVTGPDAPPAPGDGSVKLDPTAFDHLNEDQTQAVLRTLQYAGTTIANITRLGFSVFVPAAGGDPPSMQLGITGTFNTNQFASLIFPSVATAAWTVYTPTQAGLWSSSRDIVAEGGGCLLCCSVGGCGTREAACFNATTHVCTGPTQRAWSDIAAGIPHATLNGSSPNDGGYSFRIGRGDTGAGYVTNVVFNDDGFYFEQD